MKKHVIIFGRGRYFDCKSESIKKDYEIAGFIDNSVRTGDVSYTEDGLRIYNPEDYAGSKDEDNPIMLMSARFFEMYAQLRHLGIPDERIIFGVSVRPHYDNAEKIIQDHAMDIHSEDGEIIVQKNGKRIYAGNEEGYYELIRGLLKEERPEIGRIQSLPMVPVSRRFGLEYGKAIDRYYIEKFISDNSEHICGDVLEVAENTYTEMFKSGDVNSMELHVKGWGGRNVIKGNLETGEEITEGLADCFICTQTIQFIYDLRRAAESIYKLLKQKGGTALITAAGIAQISMYDHRNWGEYWHFTDKSLKRLLSETFGEENVKVTCYGNAKTSAAMLYGLCLEDMSEEDLEYTDEQYPMLIGAVCRKV